MNMGEVWGSCVEGENDMGKREEGGEGVCRRVRGVPSRGTLLHY